MSLIYEPALGFAEPAFLPSLVRMSVLSGMVSKERSRLETKSLLLHENLKAYNIWEPRTTLRFAEPFLPSLRRMSMLSGMVSKERSRLQTKKSLKGLFSSL